MFKPIKIELRNLVMCFAGICDMVDTRLVNHHYQVAYASFALGEEMGLSLLQKNLVALAGALHDTGAISLGERADLLLFDDDDVGNHELVGNLLLNIFRPLSKPAALIRFHHLPWEHGKGSSCDGIEVPVESHILHVADRLTVLINKEEGVLSQAKGVVARIRDKSGKTFMPEVVDAFERRARLESFWLDLASPSISSILLRNLNQQVLELSVDDAFGLGNMMRRIIDFRSRFTSTHSSGVSAVAAGLAEDLGFSEEELKLMKLAGYVHDLGKLAVPSEILEKPGQLSGEEINIIRGHTYFGYRALEAIEGLNVVNEWASFHHERLDGNGYPFHLTGNELSLGSRIMAVADVFTALTEDRPYRPGLGEKDVLPILQRMASSALDPHIVSTLSVHFDKLNSLRIDAQEAAVREYQLFLDSQSSIRKR